MVYKSVIIYINVGKSLDELLDSTLHELSS